MSNMLNITDDSFESEVIKSSLPVVVDFWAPWCGPCKALAPVLEAVAETKQNDIKFCKLNVEDNAIIPGKYNIRGIPTLLVFKDGEIVATKVGGNLSVSQLEAFLDNCL